LRYYENIWCWFSTITVRFFILFYCAFCSVPYTSGPMVRDHSRLIGFELFDAVVKKKVNYDGVDVCLGMLTEDLPSDELYGPNAAACKVGISQFDRIISFVGKLSQPRDYGP
jgi:hypothetical protein